MAAESGQPTTVMEQVTEVHNKLPPRKLGINDGEQHSSDAAKKNMFQMDPKCMSCSGQLAGGLLSCFKIACLAYSPSNIVFRSKASLVHDCRYRFLS
jgi:hypothetical protein